MLAWFSDFRTLNYKQYVESKANGHTLNMEELISKEIKSALTKLGLYQILGGVVGVLISIWGIYSIPRLTGLTVFLYLFILLFFAYSIFCGILCLKAQKSALVHSLINQLFQVIGFAMMGFAFKYIAGFYLTIWLDLTDSIKFGFNAGISKFEFNYNNENERLEVEFNLIAFALIYWIDKLISKVKEEAANRQISSIGET